MARPQGSKNVKASAAKEPSRCPGCNSTESIKLGDRQVQPHAGIDSEDRPYNMIVRQRVQCDSCGQVRIDRSLEFDPELK
jgi:hypothetical protein